MFEWYLFLTYLLWYMITIPGSFLYAIYTKYKYKHTKLSDDDSGTIALVFIVGLLAPVVTPAGIIAGLIWLLVYGCGLLTTEIANRLEKAKPNE